MTIINWYYKGTIIAVYTCGMIPKGVVECMITDRKIIPPENWDKYEIIIDE